MPCLGPSSLPRAPCRRPAREHAQTRVARTPSRPSRRRQRSSPLARATSATRPSTWDARRNVSAELAAAVHSRSIYYPLLPPHRSGTRYPPTCVPSASKNPPACLPHPSAESTTHVARRTEHDARARVRGGCRGDASRKRVRDVERRQVTLADGFRWYVQATQSVDGGRWAVILRA